MRLPTRARRQLGRIARRVAPDAAYVGWPPELPGRGATGRDAGAKPRIGLVGFYGPGNYSDELILEAVVSAMRREVIDALTRVRERLLAG